MTHKEVPENIRRVQPGEVVLSIRIEMVHSAYHLKNKFIPRADQAMIEREGGKIRIGQDRVRHVKVQHGCRLEQHRSKVGMVQDVFGSERKWQGDPHFFGGQSVLRSKNLIE